MDNYGITIKLAINQINFMNNYDPRERIVDDELIIWFALLFVTYFALIVFQKIIVIWYKLRIKLNVVCINGNRMTSTSGIIFI